MRTRDSPSSVSSLAVFLRAATALDPHPVLDDRLGAGTAHLEPSRLLLERQTAPLSLARAAILQVSK